MAKKKKDEMDETVDQPTEATEQDAAALEAAPAEGAENAATADSGDDTSILDTVVEAATGAVETVAAAVSSGAATIASAIGIGGDESKARHSKRAEKVGVVSSDKMMKTVTVRVDRLVKHPTYRKYVKRRKKFMAHDELGAKIGDKVKIVETRPLSARKRWRVVEIIQKAEL